MKSRIVQAGALVGAGLGIVLVVGAILDLTVLMALAVAGLGLVVCVGVADTDRRLRRLERGLGARVEPVEPRGPQQEVSEADVLGVVRLLQAQYTGRLDRLHQAVEELATSTRNDLPGPPKP